MVNSGVSGRFDEQDRPLLSLVVSVYRVEAYLPDFLASLDAQQVDRSRLELTFVIDGSPDDSEAVIRRWLEHREGRAQVVTQPNAGPSAARNAGLGVATGVWVSFPDPDDMLSPDYLAQVVSFIEGPEAEQVAMVAGRVVPFTGDPSRLAEHPIDFKFDRPLRIVDLDESPNLVHLHVASAFYRLDAIRDRGLAFDVRIAPVFEDGAFNSCYLLAADRPVMALVKDARYLYRRREDQSSLTGSAWHRTGKYVDVFRYGYLELLARAGRPAPRWLQYQIFYDLQWYPKADDRMEVGTVSLPPDVRKTFFALLHQTLQHIDDETILRFTSPAVPIRMRLGFLAFKNGSIPTQTAHVVEFDPEQQLMLVRYLTSAPQADEVLRYEGAVARPAFAKTTRVDFFGRTWLYERDLWVSAVERVTLEVAGEVLRIELGANRVGSWEAAPEAVWKRFARERPPGREALPLPPTSPLPPSADQEREDRPAAARPQPDGGLPARVVRRSRRLAGRVLRRWRRWARTDARPAAPEAAAPSPSPKRPLSPAALRRQAQSPAVRGRFADAWVLMDRDTMAQDNAEAFYRYLTEHHPEVNAWFVLSDTAPDWARLRGDGFRLVAYGSDEHVLLMKHATYLLSSQIDAYIVRPYDAAAYGAGTWRYVFLQHGVTHNNISGWINSKPIHLMITSTGTEHASIVGDGSPYRYTEKQVALTEMPRHDALLRKAAALGEDRPRTILVAPTWRRYLVTPGDGGHRRELVEEFLQSLYYTQWSGLLASPRLRSVAAAQDLTIEFAPHPNLQHHVEAFELPDHVRVIAYDQHDIQEVIARARLMVTDYSSMGFEAAYLRRPVVYFQFDQADFYSGRHPFRPGDFSYARHGFGPVVTELDAAIDAIAGLAAPGVAVPQPFRQRIEDAYPFRDGRANDRIYDEIRRRERPWPAQRTGAAPDRVPGDRTVGASTR